MLSCVSHSFTEGARVMRSDREGGEGGGVEGGRGRQIRFAMEGGEGGVEGGKRWRLLQRQRKTGSASEFELKHR